MYDDASGREKRQYVRVDISFPVLFLVRAPLDVRVDFGDVPAKGMAEDLSEGGMAFVCDFPVPENTILNVKFSLLNVEISPVPRAFDLNGDVRYRSPRDRKYRIGLRFQSVLEEDRQALVRYIRYAQGRSDF